MLFEIRTAILLELISPHPINLQRSPYCPTFLTVIPIYHSKVTPISGLQAEEIAVIGLLYVFKITIPASSYCIIHCIILQGKDTGASEGDDDG